MTRNPKLKLTSVLIVADFQDPLAIDNVTTKMTLQKIINRSLHLYLTDEYFKRQIMNHTDLLPTGSL